MSMILLKPALQVGLLSSCFLYQSVGDFSTWGRVKDKVVHIWPEIEGVKGLMHLLVEHAPPVTESIRLPA